MSGDGNGENGGRLHHVRLTEEKLKELVRERYERPLPRRFYKEVEVAEADGGWRILLDGKALRTPLKRPFVVPSRALAEAAAEEWRTQGEKINPATMPMTGLANAAIDRAGEGEERRALMRALADMASHDMLCYRAPDNQPELAGQQRKEWDPLLDWATRELGAPLKVADGIMPRAQEKMAVKALLRHYEMARPFVFAPLFSMATLSNSAVLPLAVWRGRLRAKEAWEASVLEERWNMRLWGEDAQALKRLKAREEDFLMAANFLQMLEKS